MLSWSYLKRSAVTVLTYDSAVGEPADIPGRAEDIREHQTSEVHGFVKQTFTPSTQIDRRLDYSTQGRGAIQGTIGVNARTYHPLLMSPSINPSASLQRV